MREFSWQYFKKTGAIDAYLLYKEYEKVEQMNQDLIHSTAQEEIAATEE